MLPRKLLVATLAAVCIYEVCNAIPFKALRRSHPLRSSNTGLDFMGRRAARDTKIQLKTPPPLQTTSPPLGPYFANHSLVGQEVECSDAAKRCLTVNKLLHEPSGMCYELGDPRPCARDGGALVLDTESFRRRQLRSKCSGPSRCKEYKMAYDGKCYTGLDVWEKLCNGSQEVIFHPLGDMECKIPVESRELVKVIRQLKSPGRCAVPNLQNNDIGPFWVECSPEEEECLEKGLLPFRGSCQAPLTNTSCPDGQWLILDEEAAVYGRLSAKCNSSRPCGSDALLLRADRSCHSNTELLYTLCDGYHIFLLPTGDYICTLSDQQYEVRSLRKEYGLCEFMLSPSDSEISTEAVMLGGLDCVLDDRNICQPDVLPPNSKPDLNLKD